MTRAIRLLRPSPHRPVEPAVDQLHAPRPRHAYEDPLMCRTKPIQAEKLRPERKVVGSPTLATRAVASNGPTPGMQFRRLLVGLERCQAMTIRSKTRIYFLH
jgi:hypothetical protein